MINININNNNDVVYCQKCHNGYMKEKNGKYGVFYGCSRYPNCKNIMKSQVYQNIVSNQKIPSKKLEGTQEQQNIWDWIKNAKKGQNLLVQARPGTGKTTTIEHSLPFIANGNRILYLVFNSKNAKEAELKMSHKAIVKTSHSYGRGILDQWMRLQKQANGEEYKGLGKIAYNKSYNHIINVLKSEGEAKYFKKYKWATHPILQIIELLRNRLESPSPQNIADILDTYNQIRLSTIGKNSWKFGFICEWLPEAFNNIVNDFSEFDYTDFLHLPLYHSMFDDIDFKPVDYGLFDEVQDFNKCQLELAKHILGDTGIGLFVGDDKQAIYGFRAAMNNSMNVIKNDFNCKTLPLTTTWRSPLTGIKLVNDVFPHIVFNGHPTLERLGSIEHKILEKDFYTEKILNTDVFNDATVGSLILCRNNAPLIPFVLELLSIGRKAVVVGKNIGAGLKTLINKSKHTALNYILSEIFEKIREEIEELEKENKKTKIDDLNDKMMVLEALSTGLTTKKELLNRIDSIFSNETGEVSFSSVHRAKGLEANDVYLLQPELIPSKNATKLWEKQQEENIKLIAITRHKNNLTFVSEETNGWWGGCESNEGESAYLKHRYVGKNPPKHVYDYLLTEDNTHY